jgi:hypothetical protein
MVCTTSSPEGDGFEPSVPRQVDESFRKSDPAVRAGLALFEGFHCLYCDACSKRYLVEGPLADQVARDKRKLHQMSSPSTAPSFKVAAIQAQRSVQNSRRVGSN